MPLIDNCKIAELEDETGLIDITLQGVRWTLPFRSLDAAANAAEQLGIIPKGMALVMSHRGPGLPRGLSGSVPEDFDVRKLIAGGFNAESLTIEGDE